MLDAWADARDDLAEDGAVDADRAALARRVELHVALGPLHAALRGLDTGDREALQAGLGALRAQARAADPVDGG